MGADAPIESPSIDDVVEDGGGIEAALGTFGVESPRTEAGARLHISAEDRCSRKSRLA